MPVLELIAHAVEDDTHQHPADASFILPSQGHPSSCMLRGALRLHPRALTLSVRQYARKPPPIPSTVPASPRREPYVLTPPALLAIYRKQCTHPSLTFVDPPSSPPSDGFLPPPSSGARPSEHTQWAYIAHAPTLASALDHVDHVLSLHPAVQASAPRPAPLPTWLLLAILFKPPATPAEAFAATTLALHHPHTTHELSPLVLLLAAYWLANLRMYAPLRSVVIRLVNYKYGLHDFHIALMLRILAQVHPANELQRMIVLLLDLATRNNCDLGVRTYRAILENRSATGRVASRVEQHMKARDYSPNLSHSRAFVRIYGRAGKRKAASSYWRRIRLGEYYGPKAEYITAIRHQALLLEDTLRGGKRPKQITQYVKYLLKASARAEADPTLHQSGRVPPFPGRVGIPKKVYMLALRVSANNIATPLYQLLGVFRSGLDYIGDGTKRLWCYFVTIKGLLKRSEYSEAGKLLSEIWDARGNFSAPEVTIAVEALTMIGRPDAAFRLLSSLVPESDTPLDVNSYLQGDYVVLVPKTYLRAERTIDAQAVNSYMISLLRIGRPDAVFFIWDTMRRVFLVQPDSVTLAIVLKAARYARKAEGALQVAIADFGLGRVFSLGSQSAPQDWATLGREEASKVFEALLVADVKRPVTAFWRGERAGTVALRTVWEVLTTNWPELRGFDPPCYAIRRSAGEQAVSPMSDLLHSFTSHPSHHGVAADGMDDNAGMNMHLESERMYFGIVPEDAMFRALFDLLAEEDRAAQIPLVLTWMRYLKVHPSRDTLATALVYWGEVTFEGPWIQRLRGGESQYIRLLKWITKWVGRGNVPRRDEMQKALMRVKWFRELDTFKVRSRDATVEDWSKF